MARTPVLLVPGGYGVFGRLLVEAALKTLACRIVVAGRDLRRAERLCRELATERVTPLCLDLGDETDFRKALDGVWAVACAAGPFQSLDRRLPEWAVAAGAHWLDIADDKTWVVGLMDDTVLHETARRAGLMVLPGLSSVPTLSGVLGRALAPDGEAVTLTLFIGNRNPKGAGAIASALRAGFDQPHRVRLPDGERWAYRFSSPDEVLFPRFFGRPARFQVAFEWRMASGLMARLQPVGKYPIFAKWLSGLAKPVSGWGSRKGVLQLQTAARSLVWVGEGQEMAVLPCVRMLQAIESHEPMPKGIQWAAGLFAVEDWKGWMRQHGLDWVETCG